MEMREKSNKIREMNKRNEMRMNEIEEKEAMKIRAGSLVVACTWNWNANRPYGTEIQELT